MKFFPFVLALVLLLGSSLSLLAAEPPMLSGASATVTGTVADPTGALIPGAQLTLSSASSGFSRSLAADENGQFTFSNIPLHNYRLTATAPGFAKITQTVELRSPLGVSLSLTLLVAAADSSVTVEAAGDLVETDPSFHTDVDRGLFDRMPLESETNGITSLVTLSTPGISADSNGMMHGMGDHAQNSFSLDGQPITDQQSKIFSNQIPLDSVQSLEVIAGAPPAEFGDKTSVVVKVTTRSGLDTPRPTGNLNLSYGAFGTDNVGFNLAAGSHRAGNYLAANALRSGRFLDGPEFDALHDTGNVLNLFDRADYRFGDRDSAQLNLNYTRSWFQTPWSYDNLDPARFNPNLLPGSLPATDQRSKIETINLAPSWTHTLSPTAVWSTGLYLRRDSYHYYPSANPLSDLGPADLQRESVAQQRTLTNYGLRSDLTWTRGRHNLKAGANYMQTLLREDDALAIVDPTLNSPCLTGAAGDPVASAALTSPAQCTAAGYVANSLYDAALAPYDFTRTSAANAWFHFDGHTAIKELAFFAQDAITAGNWQFNLGLRADLYNGLTSAHQIEPRLGLSYNVKRTGTVLRASYARTLETPFNENLVLSSQGCGYAVIRALVACVDAPLPPGYRNEFHAGLQQAFGPHFVLSGEYVWKYTHNAFDFSVLGNTPLTFPIAWHNSKIPGLALTAKLPNWNGFSAELVLSSVAARVFMPQVGGMGAAPDTTPGSAFRIDHDEKLNQTTHLQYQFNKPGPLNGLWAGLNWRFDSGQVAGQVPVAADTTSPVDLSGLTFAQQAQAGLLCNGVQATRSAGFTSCAPSQYASTLLSLPAPGTVSDDHNPARMKPRNLIDLSLGQQNLFHRDRYKLNLDLTAVNLTNKLALYNFLSTFSGTHFVTPRTLSAKITLNF